MGFRVRKIAHRPWPVTVKTLEGDASGNVVEAAQTFVAHYRPFTEREFSALLAEAEKMYPTVGDAPLTYETLLLRNAHLFGALVVGWGAEVVDEAGQPIPFSRDVLASMVTGPDGLALSAGIHASLYQLRHGIAPEKNSSASPAPGPENEAGEAPTSSSTI